MMWSPLHFFALSSKTAPAGTPPIDEPHETR